MLLGFVWSPYEVHDFMIRVCNSVYEHVLCLHAMVCMDIDYLLLLKRIIVTINYIGMGKISDDRVQINRMFKRIKLL